MRDQNLPPPMTNILNGVITSTLSSWGIKIRKAGHQLRANVQVAANKFSKFSVSLAYKLYPPSGIVQPVPHFNILQSRISWTISPKTVAYLPIGSMYGIYIYGNIYHQYTPNVSIYIPYMDPMGYSSFSLELWHVQSYMVPAATISFWFVNTSDWWPNINR